MDTISNLVLFILAVIATGVWIVGLCRWDGKKPCKKEDCAGCPYRGADCVPDEERTTQ